ncbi:MAG: Ger(x)C family spore germination protein [Firmicutes bacterium]|jgi:spore germination protein KC|nr:Ger(x)C family spore germination protein [Bacillota bacterium]
MRGVAIILILALLAAFCGGCWSRREITEIAIVLGMGLDLTPDGRVGLSLQIARPGAFYGGGDTAGGEGRVACWVVRGEGETLEEAAAYLAGKVPRELYWGHSVVLIFGEEMARRGVGAVADFFGRKREPRETMWVTVAEGRASDVLECHSVLEKTSAQAAAFLVTMGLGTAVRFREFVESLADEGVEPIATRVTVREVGVTPCPGEAGAVGPHRQAETSGTAVFRGDKLVGWLDQAETRGLLWLKGRAVGQVLTVRVPGKPEGWLSFRARRQRAEIVPRLEGGSVRFDVNLVAEFDMVEQGGIGDFAGPDQIRGSERLLAGAMEAEAGAVVERVRSAYGSDIFGFGDAFHRKYKREWHEMKGRWDEEFARAEVRINARAFVRETGLLTIRAETGRE